MGCGGGQGGGGSGTCNKQCLVSKGDLTSRQHVARNSMNMSNLVAIL